MANYDQPQGFKCQGDPLRMNSYVAGSACYPGDLLTLASDGKVDPATAGTLILGVCIGYASADLANVLVADHPDQLIVGQVAASEIDLQTDMGNTADILATAANTTYKISRQEINGASQSDSATAQLRLLRPEPSPNNAFGQFVDVVCAINEHQFGPAQANAGVGV
jgi:hypothetical protein